MALRNTSQRYGSVTKFFHWLIFFLVLVIVPVGFFMGDISNEGVRNNVYNIHKLAGLLILILMGLRALWALTNPKPQLPPDFPWIARFAARSVHVILYLILIAMPIVGWVGSVSAGYSPHLGSLVLSLPITQNKDLAHLMLTMHVWLAYALLFFVSLHILAAGYHYVVRQDQILQRMLPGGDNIH